MVSSTSIRSKIYTSVMVVIGLIFKLKFHVWFLGDEHTAAISAINFILPLIAAFFSRISLLVTFLFPFIVRHTGLFHVKTLGLPTFAGIFVWKMWINEKNRPLDWHLFSWIIPFGCITLFAFHPVGSQAWYYSLYWFIVPLCSLLIPRSAYIVRIFLISLHSTFIVHAIGSILVLYTTEHSALFWLSLIPRVAIERFVSAIGMVVVVYGTYWLKICFHELKPFRLRSTNFGLRSISFRLTRRVYIHVHVIKERLKQNV